MNPFAASNTHRYQNETAIFLGLVSCFLGVKVAKRVGWAAGALLSWFLIGAIRVLTWDISPYGFPTLGPNNVFTLDRYNEFSASAGRSIAFVGAVLVAMWNGGMEGWLRAFLVLSCASSLSVLFFGHALYYNGSMDASLLACTLPLFLRLQRRWKLLILVPMAAIVRSGSSTALLAAVVWMFAACRSIRTGLAVTVIGSLAMVFAPLNHGLFETSGRIGIWREALAFWREHAWFWLGSGTGSYTLHERSFHPDQIFQWLHNEYGQVLFEQGSIGLALFLATVGMVIWRSRKSWAFPSAVTMAFCMISQPLLRTFVGSIYGALIVRLAHENRGQA